MFFIKLNQRSYPEILLNPCHESLHLYNLGIKKSKKETCDKNDDKDDYVMSRLPVTGD